MFCLLAPEYQIRNLNHRQLLERLLDHRFRIFVIFQLA